MKLHLRNRKNFNKETLDFYDNNFKFGSEEESDIIVVNDFVEANYPNKIVARNSTGLDGIIAKKIISLRGSDLSDLTAVPELCLGMAIFLTRIYKKEEIRGKTFGIIGYGRIGKTLARMVESMGGFPMVYDRNLKENWDDAKGVGFYTELKDLLKYSNIVSLNIAADEENRDFMNKEKFELMKEGSIFLNSSRPWLVDEEALKWALDNKLSAAWFDFDMPFKHSKLYTTPHLGGSTKESKQKSEMIIAEKLLELYGTK